MDYVVDNFRWIFQAIRVPVSEDNPAAAKLFELVQILIEDINAQNQLMQDGEDSQADIQLVQDGGNEMPIQNPQDSRIAGTQNSKFRTQNSA
ncbi:MAG: hypothetical protein HC910_05380 [Spirulinaceae cyanobacterium SM2_1_0]|nr:hypothetical protein [Spirulinaceae cyanobacterium SM2_1_0]